MKLENQVVSLELAKRLKELGMEQEIEECSAYYDHAERLFGWTSGEDKPYGEYVKAHSVAELGEMLPIGVHTWKYIDAAGTIKWAGQIPPEPNTFGAYDIEANARAKMLIYLNENNLLSQEKEEEK